MATDQKDGRVTRRIFSGILVREDLDFRMDPDDADQVQTILERLAAYEDTGLEPDEVDDQVWRDADVELPPDDGQVLIIVSGRPRRNVELVNAYELASYVGGDGWVLESYPEWEKAEVSWWMPLPAAPKEK